MLLFPCGRRSRRMCSTIHTNFPTVDVRFLGTDSRVLAGLALTMISGSWFCCRFDALSLVVIVVCSQPHPSGLGSLALFSDEARLWCLFAGERQERDLSGWLCDLVVLGAAAVASDASPVSVGDGSGLPGGTSAALDVSDVSGAAPDAVLRVADPDGLTVVLFDQLSGSGEVLELGKVLFLAGAGARFMVERGVGVPAD